MRDIINRFEPHVYLVDDDEDFRASFSRILANFGAVVRTFASAADFLSAYRPSSCECLLTDNHMPRMTGMELQQILAERYPNLPVIIITGYADVGLAMNALRAGSFEFIEKPCDPDHLRKRTQDALAKSAMLNLIESKVQKLRARFEKISPRESEVLERVLAGVKNKNIAYELDISEKTVEVHRNNIKNKLGATSFGNVFSIVSFLRNVHKDYISLLDEIDINRDIIGRVSECSNPLSNKRCEILLDLIRNDDSEESESYKKMKIILELVALIENCEFSKDNFCQAQNCLFNINVA